MYVHIGGEYSVSNKFIIGIFDFDGTTNGNSETIQYLKKAEQKDLVESVSEELPRSFIVTLDRVYYSPISTATLRHRLRQRRTGLDNIQEGNKESECFHESISGI
ncbi:MAG: DUF370 domain-containing protein [Clostridiaceae bacterium]|nr:DUF370 domain-containing protein [Clostridiaceae bacterium]